MAELFDIFFKTVVGFVEQAADAKGVGGQARAAILLKDFQNFFPLAEAVEDRRHRPDIQRVRAQPEQVAGDALQLGEDGAHPARPRRRFRAQQFFHRFAVAQAVGDRRHVVGAVHVGSELSIGTGLADFLHPAVQVADDAFRTDDFFPVELQLDAQHAVGGGVLRAHVEDDFIGAQYGGADGGCLSHDYCPLSIPRFSFTQATSCWRMS